MRIAIDNIRDREILTRLGWTLAVKLTAVALLGLLFFGPHDRMAVNADAVAGVFSPEAARASDAAKPEHQP